MVNLSAGAEVEEQIAPSQLGEMLHGRYKTYLKENTIILSDGVPIFPLFLVFANSPGKYLMLSLINVPLFSPASVFRHASRGSTVVL